MTIKQAVLILTPPFISGGGNLNDLEDTRITKIAPHLHIPEKSGWVKPGIENDDLINSRFDPVCKKRLGGLRKPNEEARKEHYIMKRLSIFSIIAALTLAACGNPRAENPGVWYWPPSWGDQTLYQSLEAGCVGGATSTVIANSTYPCPNAPAVTAPTNPSSPAAATPGNFAPGSIYSETPLGENIWGNGPKMDWKAASDPADKNTYLVIHGDLRARQESAIAVFKSVKAASGFLKDGTWKVLVVSITGTGTLDDYLQTLNKRLGGNYTVVLKPPVP